MSETNRETEFRQRVARLLSNLQIRKAQVLPNPEPYLNDLTARCVELVHVLDDTEYALSPDCAADWALSQTPPIELGNLQGEALIRCSAALDVLCKYRRGEYYDNLRRTQ